MSDKMTLIEAAQMNRVTRQALYLAVKLGRLKAHKRNRRWEITKSDMEDYNKKKYSRIAHTTIDGKKLYDEKKGPYTVDITANLLGVDKQRIYYEIRRGRIRPMRYGTAYVITKSEIDRYTKKYLVCW